MTYIRFRPRMVRQSVYEDVRSLLNDLGWIPSLDWQPDDPWSSSDIMGFVSSPVVLTDYNPVDAVYQGSEVDQNTLALDQGTPAEPYEVEVGGYDREQNYTFNFAFFAESDAVAMSLYSDFTDRYKGIRPGALESVTLYNYLDATPTPVVDMEVISFEVAKSPEQPAPGQLLWFAQLVVADYLE